MKKSTQPRMMTEYDLTIILMAETRAELLQRITNWNKFSEGNYEP